MNAVQNDRKTFPLNLERLKDHAQHWVNEFPDVPIETITLYRYSSKIAEILGLNDRVKYCVVFGLKYENPREYDPYKAILDVGTNNIPARAWLKNEPLHEIDPETRFPKRRPLTVKERAEARINREKCEAWIAEKIDCEPYDPDSPDVTTDVNHAFLECSDTGNRNPFSAFLVATFEDVYRKKKLFKRFKEEWTFTKRYLMEGNRFNCVWDKDPCWVLFDVNDRIESSKSAPVSAPPAATKTAAVNFFRKESASLWHIGFEGKDNRIKHLTGLQYIGYLLERQGKTISCRELYQAASGAMPDNITPKGIAISEELNMGHIRIPASDYEAKQIGRAHV